jgi:hypothetical protein
MNRVQSAVNSKVSAEEVAKAAVQDAVESATSEKEKEALALALYKEATGRFPQDSSDRRAVYTGGFWLLGSVFVVIAGVTIWLVLQDKAVPESVMVLATALVSGVIGGLFGYAKQ